MIASLIRYPGGRGSIELEPKNLHGLRQSLDGVRRTMARPESLTAARLVSRSPPRDRKWDGSASSGAVPSGPTGDLLRPDGTSNGTGTAPPSPSAEFPLAAGSGERSAASAVSAVSAVSAAAASPVYSACRWARSTHRQPAYVSAAAHVPGVGDVSVPTCARHSAIEERRRLAETRQQAPPESVDGTHVGLSALTRKKESARAEPNTVDGTAAVSSVPNLATTSVHDGTAAVSSAVLGTYAVAGEGDPPATGRRLYVTTRSASAPKLRVSEVPKHETVLALVALIMALMALMA